MNGITGGRCQAVRGKIHNMIVQPAVMHGMETVPTTSS